MNLIPLAGAGRGRELSQERVPNASGSGSGVIIDPDGHIITNNHVIGDATEIEVRFSDKSKLIAQVVGKDLDTDLAVLKVTADHPLASKVPGIRAVEPVRSHGANGRRSASQPRVPG